MSSEIEHIATRMARYGEKTLGYFQDLTSEEWQTQVYTTGSEWTVRDILAHFVSAERAFYQLVEDVAAGGSGAPRDLDIVEFNEREVPKLDPLSPEELLDAFDQARAESVQLTQNLNTEDLDKVGYHPWFGEVELRDMVKLVYRHNMIHLRDVRKAIREGRPVPHKDIEPPSAS